MNTVYFQNQWMSMLEKLDLNLLCYVDIMLEELNISRSASRLHMTQSALSNALARARVLLNDDILVRSGKNMIPTPYGIRIQKPLRQAIERLKVDILPQKTFDPQTDCYTFRTAFRGYEETIIFPELLATLSKYPNLCLRNQFPTSLHDVEGLTNGSVHFTLTPHIRERDGIMVKKAIVDDFVCIASENYSKRNITADNFCRQKHLLVSLYGGPGIVDGELEKLGLKRNISISVGEFGTAPLLLLSDSKLMTTIPRSLANIWQKHYPLVAFPCPIKIDPLILYLSWHSSSLKSPELVWFKNQLEAVWGRLT